MVTAPNMKGIVAKDEQGQLGMLAEHGRGDGDVEEEGVGDPNEVLPRKHTHEVDVARHPGDQVAGLGAVVVGEGEALEVVVEHVTQVEGHVLGDVLIDELCTELKPAAGDVNGDHDQGSEQQVFAVSPDEATIHDLFEHPRHREVGCRCAQETEIGEAPSRGNTGVQSSAHARVFSCYRLHGTRLRRR